MIKIAEGIHVEAKQNPEAARDKMHKAGYPPAQAAAVLANANKNIASTVPSAVPAGMSFQESTFPQPSVPGTTFTPPAAG